MECYRLCFVDLPTGRVKNFGDFEVANDSAALVQADQLRGDRSMKLRCHNRRIRRLGARARAGRTCILLALQ